MEVYVRLEVKKFGDILVSRPAGREAFLIIKSYLNPNSRDEVIELDFTGVNVMAPSWLHEVYLGITEELGNKVVFLPSSNPSVTQSIKTILE